ncbi:hypothetical protein [Streptomyces sp. NRRL S-1868]|uniref:hypothetical protein n=1 Tax=Streptomyces sp. NRRL S-1868 TaxID=1463892 RepID=UPI0004C70759|nr:hypothetical protein [Streptomyces sp. NRRL S-1868]
MTTTMTKNKAQASGGYVTVAAVLARAVAYGVRATTTRRAVERLKSRYLDRAASAQYLSEAMSRLNVDEPTTTAYAEVSSLSHAMADNVDGIVSSADGLSTAAQGLEQETQAQHGRMREANRSHHVPMADREFVQRN